MATLRLITEQDFRSSRYGQVADQIEGRLSDLIAQAEDHIEAVIDRRLKTTSYVELFRPSGEILFPRQRPITAITQVRRRLTHNGSWTTLNNADFEIAPSANYVTCLIGESPELLSGVPFGTSMGIGGYHVELTYTAGYTTIPWDVKAAVILQTVVFAYQDLEVYGAGDAKIPGIVYLQDQVDRYLRPYRKLTIV